MQTRAGRISTKGRTGAARWLARDARTLRGAAGLGAMTPAEAAGLLGVDVGASEDDVQKAFRRLALKLHPDKATQTGTPLAAPDRTPAPSSSRPHDPGG